MSMMKVGFTGTRKGMSRAQARQFERVWFLFRRARWYGAYVDGSPVTVEFHHGGAVGADLEAGTLVRGYDVTVVTHRPRPGTGAAGLLARNREIVDAVDVLIAAPASDREIQRSGTWATVRYARKAGKPVIMLSRGTS